MSTKLEDFIINILNSETIEEERIVITNEMANMRSFVRECDPKFKPSIITKLWFLDMRGENTFWGHMEVVNLMAHERTSYKRIGYLAAANMFDESSELSVLITHTMQKDLGSPDQAVLMLPLTLLANTGSAEMCRSLVTQVQQLLDHVNLLIQKKAAMASAHIIKKVPDLAESFRPWVQKLLNHSVHSIVSAGISIAIEMMKVDSTLAGQWSSFAIPFTKILRNLYETRAPQEFQFSIFNDPFLMIKIMKILAYLRSPSEELDELLASIVTGVDVRRNTGRSILFQAIQTINNSAKKPSLRALAYNQVGRLFTFKEPNVLYSALSSFSHILYEHGQIIDRSSADSVVLQRYKSQVVECLDHRDASIRRRALDVVTALVDPTNVETLIPEVMAYLTLADGDFRAELVAKVFSSVQRFAPSAQWNFDTTLKLILGSGNYVGADVISSFCRLIGKNEGLRFHALTELQKALPENIGNQPLVQVSAWALGEFLEQATDAFDNLAKILSMPQTSAESKGYIVVALAKMAVRLGLTEKAVPVLQSLSKSNELELQQRAGELLRVLARPALAEDLLAPLEFDEDERAGVGDLAGSASTPALVDDLLSLEPAPAAPARSAVEDLLGLSAPPPTTPTAPTPMTAPTTPQKPAESPKKFAPPPGAVEALATPDYKVFFEVQRNANNPSQMAIRASVFNLGPVPLTNFAIQFGLPRGWALSAQKPSANVLEAAGGRPIVQLLMLQNNGGGPLQMRTQVTYMYRSQPMKEMGQVNPIFDQV